MKDITVMTLFTVFRLRRKQALPHPLGFQPLSAPQLRSLFWARIFCRLIFNSSKESAASMLR